MSALYGDVPAGLKMESMDSVATPRGGLAYWSQQLLMADHNLSVALKDQPVSGWWESDDQSVSPINDRVDFLLDSDPDSDLLI